MLCTNVPTIAHPQLKSHEFVDGLRHGSRFFSWLKLIFFLIFTVFEAGGRLSIIIVAGINFAHLNVYFSDVS